MHLHWQTNKINYSKPLMPIMFAGCQEQLRMQADKAHPSFGGHSDHAIGLEHGEGR